MPNTPTERYSNSTRRLFALEAAGLALLGVALIVWATHRTGHSSVANALFVSGGGVFLIAAVMAIVLAVRGSSLR